MASVCEGEDSSEPKNYTSAYEHPKLTRGRDRCPHDSFARSKRRLNLANLLVKALRGKCF